MTFYKSFIRTQKLRARVENGLLYHLQSSSTSLPPLPPPLLCLVPSSSTLPTPAPARKTAPTVGANFCVASFLTKTSFDPFAALSFLLPGSSCCPPLPSIIHFPTSSSRHRILRTKINQNIEFKENFSKSPGASSNAFTRESHIRQPPNYYRKH